jgi:hypothetical protein
MNNNSFKGIDNEIFKNLSNMMGNLPINNNPFGGFNFKKIRKYILLAVLSLFLSGVAVGLLIGLMF